MTDFSITPPEPTREQALLWSGKSLDEIGPVRPAGEWDLQFARRAIAWATPIVAQLAADAELEACVNRQRLIYGNNAGDDLRAARRQEPKSKLQLAEELINYHEDGWVPSPAQWHAIREGLAEGRRASELLAQIPWIKANRIHP